MVTVDGGIAERGQICYNEFMICNLCPRECGVDRSAGPGVCGAPDGLRAALALPFLFEEPPISGRRGCGAVFFSHCNLSCVFCQNHEISAGGGGRDITSRELADILLRLSGGGVHTINLVSPTPYADRIAEVLREVRGDLGIPVIWNSNGYEKAETIAALEGLVDVYLPDLKYVSNDAARRCSGAPDYPEAAAAAIEAMKRQVGDLVTDEDGIARRGLIVRHLVLPGMVDETRRVLSWIAEHLGTGTSISLMSQYYPTHRAMLLPGLDRPVSPREYEEACEYAISLGFENGWFQEEGSRDGRFTPEFDLRGL
jgi:putative pyruvate formate lyase activating enzyme